MSVIRSGIIVALAICLVTLGTARAANVTWSAPVTISGDSDVSNAGALVAAYNIGDPNVSATTINGVTFSAFPIANGSTSVTSGSLTVAGFSSEPMGSTSLLGSGSAPYSGLSASYQAMLSTGATKSSNTVHILDVTVSGLTVGNPYTLQVWTNDSNATTNTGSVYDFNGNNKLIDFNTTDAAGGLGQFIIGTFTADATTQFFSVHAEPFNVNTALLNGLQLRTNVPEPATLGLVALAAACILGRRVSRSATNR